jgi:hypothetical protein
MRSYLRSKVCDFCYRCRPSSKEYNIATYTLIACFFCLEKMTEGECKLCGRFTTKNDDSDRCILCMRYIYENPIR